jgi:hypothetical protein
MEVSILMPRDENTQWQIDEHSAEAGWARKAANYGDAIDHYLAIIRILEDENQHLYECLDPIIAEARKVDGTI